MGHLGFLCIRQSSGLRPVCLYLVWYYTGGSGGGGGGIPCTKPLYLRRLYISYICRCTRVVSASLARVYVDIVVGLSLRGRVWLSGRRAQPDRRPVIYGDRRYHTGSRSPTSRGAGGRSPAPSSPCRRRQQTPRPLSTYLPQY